MADPFLGQLMLVGFNFAPINYALAAGQILPISQYTALFSLLGTTYGGNGTSNFQLPNLQGNVPIGFGQSPGTSDYVQGETGGTTTVTLTASETPNHTHTPYCRDIKGTVDLPPTGHTFAEATANIYSNNATQLTGMSPQCLTPSGGNQPHENTMPYLGMYWIIAMSGVYPSRG
jgi:microcystin-dependent protein